MPPAIRCFGLGACLLGLVACQRGQDAEGLAPTAQADAAPAPAGAGNAADHAAIAGAYACDAGTRLSRNGDGSFRAEIPGNPPIRLTRIAGSEPPVFTGASLYLRIDGGETILSQGDRTNELRCTATQAQA